MAVEEQIACVTPVCDVLEPIKGLLARNKSRFECQKRGIPICANEEEGVVFLL